MIGNQHQATPNEVRFRFTQSPSGGETAVDRVWRRNGDSDAGAELAQNAPSCAGHPSPRQVKRREILVPKLDESDLAALD